MNKLVVFVTMAMRDVHFFVKVAQQLCRSQHDVEVRFVSFYQAGNAEISKSGFHCYDVYAYRDRVGAPENSKAAEYERTYGIANLHRLILHEKVTSANFDDVALEQKFMTGLDAADAIMRELLSGRTAGDVTVIQELGGFLGPLSVFFACRRHNVDHVFLEPSFFRKRLHFVRNSLMAVDCARTEPTSVATADSAWLQRYLEDLRRVRNPVIPDKDVHHFRDMGLAKILNRDNLAKLRGKLVNKYLYHHRHEFEFILNYSLRHARMYLNRRLNALLYSDFGPDARSARYVYFPFHVQLDYALTIRCPEYLNQLALVDHLCSILPAGVALYIKEHPASIGGFGYGELRRLLRRHANLRLIHPSVNSYDLAENARLVVTINSKAGAEALVMSKPVIVLGDAFYTHSGLAAYVANPRDLEKAVWQQLSDRPIVPAPQETIEFFQRVWRHTFAGELYNLDDANVAAFTGDIRRYLETTGSQMSAERRSTGGS